MAAQKGLEMLLKVDTDGLGSFATVGGIQTSNMSINNSQVDITSQDETSRWRKLLAGAGVKSVSAGGEGVMVDDAAIASIIGYAMADTHRDWQVIVPDVGTFEGPFQVNVDFGGEHDGEVTNSISIESAGDLTFTPAA